MGSILKSKVGDIEHNTMEGRIRRVRIEVVGCVQDLVGKKIFLVQIENVKKKDMISISLVFLSSKGVFNMDEILSNYPEKEQVELLIIARNPEVGEPFMFGRGLYLSVFYCLWYVKLM